MSRDFDRLLRWLFTAYSPRIYQIGQRHLNKVASLSFRKMIGSIEDGCQVDHPFDLIGGSYIKIGSYFSVGPGLRLEALDSYNHERFTPTIEIGHSVCLGHDVHIGAINRVVLGDNVLVGSQVLITDHSHGLTTREHLILPPYRRPLSCKGPTIIENDVWVGDGARILSGVRIGKGAVVGANAVVTRDVNAYQVVVGVPAKPLLDLG